MPAIRHPTALPEPQQRRQPSRAALAESERSCETRSLSAACSNSRVASRHVLRPRVGAGTGRAGRCAQSRVPLAPAGSAALYE
jgi:hypothetical protein